MKNNSKKVISLFLCAGVILAGCGNNTVAETEETTTSTTTTTATTTTTQATTTQVTTTTTQAIDVETPEDVMDLIDEYLTKNTYNYNDYSDFGYYKNIYDAVFVKGSYFMGLGFKGLRSIEIKPELYISTSISDNDEFKVRSLVFRMEVLDESKQSERYILYADGLTIKSGSDEITVTSDSAGDSEFESSYYLSKFSYAVSSDDFEKLQKMLESGTVTFEIKTQNAINDYTTIPVETTYEPVIISYELSESDITILKQLFEINDYLSNIFDNQ